MTLVSTQAIMARVRTGESDGLRLASDHLLDVANAHAPRDTGRMIDSGRVVLGDDGEAAVTYDSAIAAAVHEDLTAQHDPGRNAKWLENAFNSEAGEVAKTVAAALRRQIEG